MITLSSRFYSLDYTSVLP